MKKQKFIISGMSCAACRASVERSAGKVPGVKKADVSLLAGTLTVEYDGDAKELDKSIISAVAAAGYGAKTSSGSDYRMRMREKELSAQNERKKLKKRFFVSLCILLPLMYIAMADMLGLPFSDFIFERPALFASAQALLAATVLVINRKFFISGAKSALHGSPNMDTLVSMGSAAAFGYGVYALALILSAETAEAASRFSHSLYFDSAAMILTLVTLGKFLEAGSKMKTSLSLDRLAQLAPATATVLRGEGETVVPASELKIGDIIIIKPGEKLPADGEVVWGRGSLDQSAVTGESIPVEKTVGDKVICATLNLSGTMHICATGVGEDTTLARIVRLVEDAGASKAPVQRLADKVSAVFVPAVLAAAVLTAAVWLIAGKGAEFAVTSAAAVLCISCPCALGLATPVAITVGTGKAAEHGILIKTAESLENLKNTDTIVFDKTGTVTTGKPAVTDIIPLDGREADAFLRLAAAVEAGSEHPLAGAVCAEAENRGLKPLPFENFASAVGRGACATVEGTTVFTGNIAYIKESTGAELSLAESTAEALARDGKTPLIFADAEKAIGVIAVADTLREESRAAIAEIRKMGIRCVMLTGDRAETAEAVKRAAGLDKVFASLMPDDKAKIIASLISEGRRVAMVGDGINDAPALAAANIGIAIGAGTDIAIDSADVVLMKSSLADIVFALKLSKRVMLNIRENLFWAFFYNILGIPLAAGAFFPAFGIRLNPMFGAAAMSLSSVTVVINSLRIFLFGKAKLKKENESMKNVIKVDGMMCEHCVKHVKDALEAVDGVKSAVVDLKKKTATVDAEGVSDDALIKAIVAAGYKARI